MYLIRWFTPIVAAAISLDSAALAQPAKKAGAATAPAAWLDPDRAEPAGMKYRTFLSKSVGEEVSYLIHLPAGYDANPAQRFPVIYWLHGRGGSQSGAGVFASRLDAAVKAGTAPATIIVGVNGMRISSWVDSFDGRTPVQSMLVKDLVPHIDATYRTIARREARAIEGFSMGGAGAAKIGFKHPELFGVVGIMAGALHDLESYMGRGTAFQDIYGGNKEYFEANSPWSLAEKNAARLRARTFVRVAVGGKDALAGRNTQYHELLGRLGIEHEFDVVPDAAHNPGQVYDGLGEKTARFYARAFAAKPAADAKTLEWRPASATAPDGTQVALFWAAPAGSGPFPVAVFLHGAPGGVGESGLRRLLGSSRWTRYVSEGYAVCVADYRGHAEDKPFDVIKGAVDATDDLAAVIKTLAAERTLDVARLAITGQSLGGLITLEAVSRGKISPACIMVSAPATFPFLGYRGGRGGQPDRDLADHEINREAALARVQKIAVPTLIIQGTADGLCALNKKLFELMQAAGRDARLELFEGAAHGFINGPENENYARALDLTVGFIARHTGRQVAAVAPSAGRALAPGTRPAEPLPAPTHANVSYGAHARQRFDLWLAPSARPTPLVLFIHGGGFIGGSKGELNARDLGALLAAGISVAAIEYRLIADAKLPAAHADAVRAVQFLRSRSAGWNFDRTRVGAFGGSAGAQLCMYLAFHDDLADPRSTDPVARESSRLACVAPGAGQITMDMKWWREHVPDALASRTNEELFGTADEAAAMKINAGISALTLISKDDPPVFMSYAMAPGQAYPDNPQLARNWKIHHVVHGLTLKKLCDELGVEAHLKYPGASTAYDGTVQFLIAKLQNLPRPADVSKPRWTQYTLLN